MKAIVIGFAVFSHLCSPAQLRLISQSHAENFYNRAMVTAKPAVQHIVHATAKALYGRSVNADSLRNSLRANPQLATLRLQDLDAILMFILMEANNDTEKDLHNALIAMQNPNNKKKQQRDEMNGIKRAQDSIRQKDSVEYNAIIKSGRMNKNLSFEDFKKQSDTEYAQIRLQELNDQRSKFLSEISAIMKKLSGTEEQITENLK